MNTKQFGLFFVGVLALVFVMSAVSAVFELSPSSVSKTISSGTSSVSFDISVDNNGAGGNYSLTWSGTTSQGSLVFPTLTTSVNGTNQSTSFSVNSIPANFVGTITGNLIAQSSLANRTVPFTVTVTSTIPPEVSSCTSNTGDLRIKKIDFTNNGLNSGTTFGKDDEWFPRENVDVEIQIKNDGNERINNVEVNWGLYNTQTNEWVIELVDEKDFDVKDGKTETLTVSFNLESDLDIDLSELTDGNDYKFYVTAQGEVDDGNDTSTCVSSFETTSVVVESDFVVLDNMNFPESVQCGTSVEITADVWNVGDNDQDEVSVYVTNKELGLSEDVIAGDIDAFDTNKVSFTVKVPSNVVEKTYLIKIEVYDDSSDVYQNDYDDDYSEFSVPLVVKGNCGVAGAGSATVSADLVSGGMAGQELVVKATITNTGSSLKTFTVNAAGFTEWASSASADQSTLVLNPGQSRDVVFTLDVNKAVSGEQSFFIEATSGNEVTRQPVLVNIEPTSKFGALGKVFSGGNAAIWGIGLLNLILVIVIIFVAVRVSKRK
ncbi:MAG: putative S-layer protein [Nanoarchaeota archaeon]